MDASKTFLIALILVAGCGPEAGTAAGTAGSAGHGTSGADGHEPSDTDTDPSHGESDPESTSGSAGKTPNLPTELYVEQDGCAVEDDVAHAREALTQTQAGEAVAVVEVYFREECSDLGGQYAVAREADAPGNVFWLGGHGCRFFPEAFADTGMTFGVARYSTTAALFEAGPCVTLPGESQPVRSGNKAEALALFANLDEATQYAAALD